MTKLATVGAPLLLLRISQLVATGSRTFSYSFFGTAQIVAFVEVLFDDVDNHVFPLGFVIDRKYLQLGIVPTGQLLSFKSLCYSAASST